MAKTPTVRRWDRSGDARRTATRLAAMIALALAAPATALAQDGARSFAARGGSSRTPGADATNAADVLLETICASNDTAVLAPSLAKLAPLARRDPELHLRLAACLPAPATSARPDMILHRLEQDGRSDVIRAALEFVRHRGPRLHAWVALANLEGDYGGLSIEIGRFFDAGGSRIVAMRHLMGVRRPLRRPRDRHEAAGQASVRSWLERLHVVPVGRGAHWPW